MTVLVSSSVLLPQDTSSRIWAAVPVWHGPGRARLRRATATVARQEAALPKRLRSVSPDSRRQWWHHGDGQSPAADVSPLNHISRGATQSAEGNKDLLTA